MDQSIEQPDISLSRAQPAGNVLSEMRCEACRVGAPTVTAEELARYQPQVPDWQIVESSGIPQLERVFRFRTFAQALAFTVRVGQAAEEAGHHPRLITEWGRVTVNWWTHKIKGLHRNDFIMAAKTDQLYASADGE
jgi:4a-hydroxytetrahydrobiopterin dehydratase